jgi:hypothetical protein
MRKRVRASSDAAAAAAAAVFAEYRDSAIIAVARLALLSRAKRSPKKRANIDVSSRDSLSVKHPRCRRVSVCP